MLDLVHNQLTHLPESLGAIDSLRDFLYLHDNRLTTVPCSLARLTRLRYLNISENAFEALPDCVTEMVNLIELRASDNRLEVLPPSIVRLKQLRELHLRNNSLTTLAETIGALKELRPRLTSGATRSRSCPPVFACCLDSTNSTFDG